MQASPQVAVLLLARRQLVRQVDQGLSGQLACMQIQAPRRRLALWMAFLLPSLIVIAASGGQMRHWICTQHCSALLQSNRYLHVHVESCTTLPDSYQNQVTLWVMVFRT